MSGRLCGPWLRPRGDWTPGIDPSAARPAGVIVRDLEARFGADAMMPFRSDDFPAALAFTRREAFRQSRRSCVLLDTVQACLYVLTGPHQDFLVGREVVVTVTPDGKEILGAA
jgi:hypothetical protein